MGGQQNSPFAAALFQERCGFFHGLRVHAGEGFVQQQSVAPGPESAEQGIDGGQSFLFLYLLSSWLIFHVMSKTP